MSGVERLCRARADLAAGDASGNLRERLRAAAREFEAAAASDCPAWPVRLQAKADIIRDVLFGFGVPDVTVGRLPEADVAAACRPLCRFCEDAERTRPRGLAAGPAGTGRRDAVGRLT